MTLALGLFIAPPAVVEAEESPTTARVARDASAAAPRTAGDAATEDTDLATDASHGDDVVDLSEMSLEELLDIDVVVTATKTAQSQAAAPAVISVLTREDILRRGYQSLAEALRHVIGFYVVDDHVIPNAGVRGVAGGLFGESGTHQGDD